MLCHCNIARSHFTYDKRFYRKIKMCLSDEKGIYMYGEYH